MRYTSFWSTWHCLQAVSAAFSGRTQPRLFQVDQRSLAASAEKATFVWDHLIPHNKESCGLHTHGNLVPATKVANSAKADKDLRDFLQHGLAGWSYA